MGNESKYKSKKYKGVFVPYTVFAKGGEFEQDKSYNCGPYATAYLLSKYGIDKSPKSLEQIQGTNSKEGTKPSNIVNSLQRYGGFEKNGSTINDLAQKAPAMVDYQYNGDGHYSVVNKVDKDGVHIYNVAKGKEDIIPTNKFESKWHDTETNGNPNNRWMYSLKKFPHGGRFGDPVMERTLHQNDDKPFIRRILSGDTTSIQIPGENGRSTHYMSSGESDGKYYAYPSVDYDEKGNMRYFKDNAFSQARNTNNLIEFKTAQEAENFANNGYKNTMAWEKFVRKGNFADGGEFSDIFKYWKILKNNK